MASIRSSRWARLGVAACLLASSASQAASRSSLADLSLEQLSDIVVTSVSRKREALARTAASVFVIGASDIRRAGATSLPEALRLAPNLQVARANGYQYAISARGFNDVLSNKLLVTIDGRTVYSPLFSGVFWEAQLLPVDSIDRIEVVSGPASTLWGSNAVNGHINIITKAASATLGTEATVRVGPEESQASVSHGWRLGDGDALRLHASGFDRAPTRDAGGQGRGDSSHGAQAGLRGDWASAGQLVTVAADAYESDLEQLGAPRRHVSGASVRGRWVREFSPQRQLLSQATLAQTRRHYPTAVSETLNIADASLQYRFMPSAGHDTVVGGHVRVAHDDVRNAPHIVITPPERTLSWQRAFVQDEITLGRSTSLTAGASLERNPYTGMEFLPNLRLSWQASPHSFYWAAASRAVRAPSRIDRELTQPGSFIGGPQFQSEVAHVLELGHRAQPSEAWSYSAVAFVQDYRHLRSVTMTPLGLSFQNRVHGHTSGLEAWTTYRLGPRWRLDGSLALLRKRLSVDSTGDVRSIPGLGNDPRARASLSAVHELNDAHALWVSARYNGSLPDPAVPAWSAVDLRWNWRASRAVSLDVVLRNLFDPSHAEWGPAGDRSEIARSAALQLRWTL